jgi:translation initiation factor eIF-2B subunit epsilon
MDKSVLLLDSKTSECIHYEYVPADKSTFELPREIMSKRPNLDVRVDLVDCSIDICTVDVSPSYLNINAVLLK